MRTRVGAARFLIRSPLLKFKEQVHVEAETIRNVELVGRHTRGLPDWLCMLVWLRERLP